MSERPLDPGSIAASLFSVRPDRDERASQITAEALLTLVANNYELPPDGERPRSPKLRRFGLRSLVFGRNFLEGYEQLVPRSSMRAEVYGNHLSEAADFQGATNLPLARAALQNLIDPSTRTGSEPGQYLLRPFHESLLWYDARTSSSRFTVRKVRMRGTGITMARMLLDPPVEVATESRSRAEDAVLRIREALQQPSPIADLADGIERALPTELHAHVDLEDDEAEAWELGGDPALHQLARQVCDHAHGIAVQGATSGPAKLWQLRSVLALDLGLHLLRKSWDLNETPAAQRSLLLALPGPDRQQDRVRLRSERSWNEAQSNINWATTRTIEREMRKLDADGPIDWVSALSPRALRRLDEKVRVPYDAGSRDFAHLAQLAFENADYRRAGQGGFRVLMETIGLSAGGTRYRYLSATPDVLAALVGALAVDMPMTSEEFFLRLRAEWGFIVSAHSAQETALVDDLDGDELAVNVRRFERLLIESGLAAGLSDRTVLVGERAARVEP